MSLQREVSWRETNAPTDSTVSPDFEAAMADAILKYADEWDKKYTKRSGFTAYELVDNFDGISRQMMGECEGFGPIALAPHQAPVPEAHIKVSWSQIFRAAPLGLTGAAASGLTVGATIGFGAVYATRAGFGVSGASQFLVAALAGAILGQFPLGRWSDRTDRRIVLGFASLLVMAGALCGTGGSGRETGAGRRRDR